MGGTGETVQEGQVRECPGGTGERVSVREGQVRVSRRDR